MEEKIAESLAHFSSRGSRVSIKIDGEMQEIATIVRCKDCKKRNTIHCPMRNTVTNADKDFADNWFCADGE